MFPHFVEFLLVLVGIGIGLIWHDLLKMFKIFKYFEFEWVHIDIKYMIQIMFCKYIGNIGV